MEAVLSLSCRDDEVRRAQLFAGVDRWIARLLVHPQDAFAVRHMARLMLVAGFAAFANFAFSWWCAPVLYIAIVANGETIGRFLHMFSHRRVFRKPWGWLNVAPTWLASVWIGEPPYLFGAEHVANHHAQDNGPRDIGSTRSYQRDSWAGLGRYLRDFFLGASGPFGLAAQFRGGRGGRIWSRRFYLGQAVFWSVLVVRLWFDWLAALTMMLGPYLLVQAVNRANNWTEHAFINPERPDDPLHNAYTIIDSSFNTGVGFNEGYHATHHVHPGLPNHLWPQYFREHIADYAAADHLVFQRTSTNDIFFKLMFKDYKGLARHYVPWPGRPRTEEQIVALLRERVLPIAAVA